MVRRVLPLEIPKKTQTAQWLPDSSGFVYQNLEDADDPYSSRVRFHRLGSDPAVDPVLFRQYTRAENAVLATTWGPFASLSEDGRWLLLGTGSIRNLPISGSLISIRTCEPGTSPVERYRSGSRGWPRARSSTARCFSRRRSVRRADG